VPTDDHLHTTAAANKETTIVGHRHPGSRPGALDSTDNECNNDRRTRVQHSVGRDDGSLRRCGRRRARFLGVPIICAGNALTGGRKTRGGQAPLTTLRNLPSSPALRRLGLQGGALRAPKRQQKNPSIHPVAYTRATIAARRLKNSSSNIRGFR
jgi:hypothetical protein